MDQYSGKQGMWPRRNVNQNGQSSNAVGLLAMQQQQQQSLNQAQLGQASLSQQLNQQYGQLGHIQLGINQVQLSTSSNPAQLSQSLGVGTGQLAQSLSQYGQVQVNQAQVSGLSNAGLSQQPLFQTGIGLAQQGNLLQQQAVHQANLMGNTLSNSVSLASTLPTQGLNYAQNRGVQQQQQAMSGNYGSSEMSGLLPQHASQSQTKQRVFTGTITKLHDTFGFVDEDVFFQFNVVKGALPRLGDRVLVEANYNANMPFKWNASRVQLLGAQGQSNMPQSQQSGYANVGQYGTNANDPRNSSNARGYASNAQSYSTAPPPEYNRPMPQARRPLERPRDRDMRERERDRERDKDRSMRDVSRDKDNREDRDRRERDRRGRDNVSRSRSPPPRKRSRSPKLRSRTRSRSRSPPRRRAKTAPRYTVQIPKVSLDTKEANIMELKRRYGNLYIPSDFSLTQMPWQEAFPAYQPLDLDKACLFHVMSKEVPGPVSDAILEPEDANYSYSAKVMLLSFPPLEELYRSACGVNGDSEEEKTHPARLIRFLVGLRGKQETMAIGGPWSPSLDGPNPESDPGVLVKTAIRTCKALTGIDLTQCTQWYRFLEIHYQRGESTHKGRTIPARRETVVIFLPDVWSCLPTHLEWQSLQLSHLEQFEQKTNMLGRAASTTDSLSETAVTATPAAATVGDDQEAAATALPPATTMTEDEADNKGDEAMEDAEPVEPRKEPTHFSALDTKTMNVAELRAELEVRSLPSKGLKSQLVARLNKAVKSEAEQEGHDDMKSEETEVKEEASTERPSTAEAHPTPVEARKENLALKRLYKLPEKPHVLVYPSKTAKGGKLECSVMSLSLLLDYRQEDNKEHSFEVSLFSELFNEMLLRDFGFRIYRALHEAPDLSKVDKDEKDKKRDKLKKKEKKDEENDEKKETNGECKDEAMVVSDEAKPAEIEEVKVVKELTLVTDNTLLLAGAYFDLGHSGYILDKDLEELLFTLGLNLTRAQVKKLVQKVSTKNAFHYRKLAEKTHVSTIESEEDNSRFLRELAAGNKSFKVAKEAVHDVATNSSEPGIVHYKGSVVDVEQLLSKLQRSEKTRFGAEHRLRDLESELEELKSLAKEKTSALELVTQNLHEQQEKLKVSDARITSLKEEKDHMVEAINRIHDITTAVRKRKDIESVAANSKTVAIKGNDAVCKTEAEIPGLNE